MGRSNLIIGAQGKEIPNIADDHLPAKSKGQLEELSVVAPESANRLLDRRVDRRAALSLVLSSSSPEPSLCLTCWAWGLSRYRNVAMDEVQFIVARRIKLCASSRSDLSGGVVDIVSACKEFSVGAPPMMHP